MENRHEIQARIIEAGKNWESREEAMLESISIKIDHANSFGHGLDNILVGDSEDVVKSKLGSIVSHIEQQYPPSVQIQIEGIEEIKTWIQAEYEATKDLKSQPEIYDVKVEELRVEYQRRMKPFKESFKAEDAGFILMLRDSRDNLIEKNKQVKNYQQNPDEMYLKLSELLDIDIINLKKLLGNAEIIYQPFSINFVVSRVDSENMSWLKGAEGVHLSESPFTFAIKKQSFPIFADEEEKDETAQIIKHENIHNLLETIPVYGYEHPYHKYAHYLKLLRSKKTEQKVKDDIKEEILTTSVPEVLNQFRDEILTALMSEEKGEFFNKRTFFVVSWDDYTKAIESFSTAGHDITELSKLFKKEAKVTKDPELKKYYGAFESKFKPLFMSTVNSIKDGLVVSERIGDDAYAGTETLFYLLDPSQYHHISKILEHKYGHEAVENARKSANLRAAFGFNTKAVAQLLRELEQNPKSLYPIDKEAIIKRINWSVNFTHMLSELGIKTSDDLKLYRENLAKLGSLLDTENQLNKHAEDVTLMFYAIEVIGEDSKDKFQNLQQTFLGLSPNEQRLFKIALARYTRLGYEEEMPALNNIIAKMGLTNEVEGLVAQIEAERES